MDDSGFQETWEDYLKFSKKAPAEIVNAKLYFIALQAVNKTKQAQSGDIRSSLAQPMRKIPKLTIGEFLALRRLRKEGPFRDKFTKNGKRLRKGGSKAEQLAKAVQKIVNARVNAINFLRVGWYPALRTLNFWNRKDPSDQRIQRRFGPEGRLPVKLQQLTKFAHGVDKGRVIPARLEQPIVKGTIFNDVGSIGLKTAADDTRVHSLIQEGLNKGIREEIASMKVYIDKKMQAQFEKMKSSANSGILP
jgi:hypothetical protein